VFGTAIFKESFVIGNTGIGATYSVIVLALSFVLSLLQIVYLGAELAPGSRGKER
jgi:hypothetical protein